MNWLLILVVLVLPQRVERREYVDCIQIDYRNEVIVGVTLLNWDGRKPGYVVERRIVIRSGEEIPRYKKDDGVWEMVIERRDEKETIHSLRAEAKAALR